MRGYVVSVTVVTYIDDLGLLRKNLGILTVS